ncbi:hypothetical protein LTR53_014842 [Teratosphaeriaceae sp. CCFEE 6253]|nr:hypothetical protein LTR53_014842 [Teratosphaeriaceae sp. CCFEE 6253]
MISDFDVTGLSLVANLPKVDSSLATLNRELRFIARTLARLSHREDAAVVFSTSTQSHTPPDCDSPAELSEEPQQCSPTMLQRLFFSPTKAKFDLDDIESAPATPGENDSPGTVELGAQRPFFDLHRRHTTAGSRAPRLELPLELATPTKRRPAPLPRPVSWCGEDALLMAPSPSPRPRSRSPSATYKLDTDTVPIIVDQRSQTIFAIPWRHLSSRFAAAHKPSQVAIEPDRSDYDQQRVHEGIYLPAVAVADFSDFAQWTQAGRILALPPRAGDAEWHVEHCARRLVAAIALSGIMLSPEYEDAALAEFESLGPLLEWPEDYVNGIFAATSTQPSVARKPVASALRRSQTSPHRRSVSLSVPGAQGQEVHPARQLIVEVVAAKTSGIGKARNVRLGPRRKATEEGEDDGTRIRSGTFWGLYDERCRELEAEGQPGQHVHPVEKMKDDDQSTAMGMGFVRMDSVRDRWR